MAKFKIYLINLNTTSKDETTYFKQLISEFYSQRDEYLKEDVYSYCYTNNEKFSESTNSQKKLTFSMNRKIIRDDRIEDNPFVYNIAVGTQLLLEDKYGEHHLMTVSNIQYEFKEVNLIYNYECQDSFTWQLSRQNDGYEIVNDSSSIDFIGEQDIDAWTKKICTDCNVIYQYIELSDDLRKKPSFNKKIIFSGSGTADSMLISLAEQYGLRLKTYEHLDDNGVITKQFKYVPIKSLRPSGLKYSPYHNIQNFGLTHNGTSLSSVLNVQANEVNDNLITLIPSVTPFFRSWFSTDDWANTKFTSGMFMSKCQAQSESYFYEDVDVLIHKGPLTNLNFMMGRKATWIPEEEYVFEYTTMQIYFGVGNFEEGNTVVDINFTYNNTEFNQIQLSWIITANEEMSEYKLENLRYCNSNITNLDINAPGTSHEIINITYPNTIDNYKWLTLFYTLDDPYPFVDNTHLYWPIGERKLLPYYDKVRFNSQENLTYIYSEQEGGSGTVYHANFNTDGLCYLIRRFNPITKIQVNKDKIPDSWYDQSYEYIIQIPITITENLTEIKLKKFELYIDYYRNPTQEDLEFAEIADQCPWLENKLIDFSYFYNHQIINQYQYKELQKLIQDDLRLANAQLLLYSQLYYQALQNKTKSISQLEIQIDKIGGAFNTEFIEPLNTNGHFESSDFVLAYSNLFGRQANEKVGLLDYHKTISDYLNKYISSEQTFLKNLYEFTQYFNEKKERQLYTYTLTINNSDKEENPKYFFTAPSGLTKADSSFTYKDVNGRPTVDIWEQQTDGSDKLLDKDDIITWDQLHTKSDLYYLKEETTKKLVEGIYSSDIEYFYPVWETEFTAIKETLPIIDTTGKYQIYKQVTKKEENNNTQYIYIRHLNSSINPLTTTTTTIFSLTFLINQTETIIIADNSKYYYEKATLDDLKRGYLFAQDLKIKRRVPYNFVQFKDDNNDYGKAIKDNYENTLKEYFSQTYSIDDYEDQVYKDLYTSYFPLSSMYYKVADNNYISVDFVNAENAHTKYRRIDGSAKNLGTLSDWVNGNTVTIWGNEGLTSQDVYGTNLTSAFNSAWYSGESIVYTKSAESYGLVKDKLNEWDKDVAQNILFTYASLKKSGNASYYYRPKYWRLVSSPNNASDRIFYICLKEKFSGLSEGLELDIIENYPLKLASRKLDVDSKYASVYKYLSDEGVSNQVYIFEEIDYQWEDLDVEDITWENIKEYVQSNWYDSNSKLIDLTKQEDFISSFYITQNSTNYLLTKDSSFTTEDWNTYSYFIKFNGKYIPRYTLQQLINNNNIYYNSTIQKTYYSWTPLDSITMTVSKYQGASFQEAIEQAFNSSNGMFTLSESVSEPEIITNGQFWYDYNPASNETKTSLQQEEAMLIETNLTEFWTNAFYASKNCRFFIPEYWQPTVNAQTNTFSSDILQLESKEDKTYISLHSKYIPTIEKTSYQPKFTFSYTTNAMPAGEPVGGLYSNQPWLRDIMDYLNGNQPNSFSKNCYASASGYSTDYYWAVGGGVKWYSILNDIRKGQFETYTNFGGWYDMIIWALKNHYVDQTVESYEQAKNDHNRVWKQIYQLYPHLIYEKAYQNQDVISSKQLLDAATFAFRQYTNIERQYNIQIIDLASIKGYEGQHLQVGDAIEIDADELYDAYDDLKSSLLQYLYISDINYDLRNDANISITVNDIKYSDKVISELIKLIR